MGIEARVIGGGRCVLAKMRLQPIPFESLDGSQQIDHVVFSTVGRDKIKCLHPRALLQLPLIRILDCSDSTGIEARIRVTWKNFLSDLEDTRSWLQSIGRDAETSEGGSVLTFKVDGENDQARASMIDPQHVILPSKGPLAGVALQRPEDRSMLIDPSISTAVDLDIAISNRLEELRQMDQRLGDERRQQALRNGTSATRDIETKREGHLLLVGPRISRERSSIESLRLRGYKVDVAQTEQDGIAAFQRNSPELVIADIAMDRSEGMSFILALRKVHGVEEIPVILVDTARRETSRKAAQRIGAAGYLVYPIEVQRVAERLAHMVEEPHRRRFTRYNRRLPVKIEGRDDPCMVTTVGRGGMFVATEDPIETNTLRHCALSLPEMGETVNFEAEVLYQFSGVGSQRPGVGVRYRSFAKSHENTLIRYLTSISESPDRITPALQR